MKELTDNELANLLMRKDKERKTDIETEKLCWNCVREINRRIDIKENNEPSEDEDMWIFLEKVFEVSEGEEKELI